MSKGALLELDVNVEAPASPVENGFGRKRLTINSVSSLVYFTLLMGIGLWYTPFMLHRVPEHIYGLVPLATSLTSHMAILMTMVTGPVCRYVAADLLKGDVELANSTFNSFFFGGLKLMAILALAVVLFCLVLPVRVPAGHETVARVLFLSIGLSFLLTSICSCFEVGYWVTHRFEIRSLMEILVLVVRNGTVVILFYFFSPDIWQIAAAAVVAAIFQISSIYAVWRRLAPQLRIDRKAQTAERKSLIYSVGRWLIVAHLGNQLLSSTDLFLINRYFGTIDNTKYGIVLLAATIVRSVFASLGLILIPAMVTFEATQSKEELVLATTRALRMFGSIAAHTTGILAGLALPLLTLWIKKPWIHEVAPVAALVLLAVTFEMFVIPLSALLIAPERITRYAIGSLVSGVTAVVLAVVLLQMTDWHYYAVAIPICVVAIAKNGVYNPILATHTLATPKYTFALIALPTLLRFVLTMLLAQMIGNWLQPATVEAVALCILATAAISLPISILTFPREDQTLLLRFVRPGTA